MNNEKEYIRHGFAAVRPYIYGHLDLPEFVKRAFGAHACRVPISSIKSMLGHTMGAASAIEAAVCCLALTHGFIPPTMNLEEPDPDCNLDYVPNQARQLRVSFAMNNAYAFGGTNAYLILKRIQ